ncbi:Phosphoglucosamine mutase [Frankliniella fusca]|uniref:Phosphoglucosamine mutase n=1 Tax=Frankliniella fusca TaxID=407009 RepID=A0AAE1LAB4_9NEOP|nr:Phosphoglucosamine mutase [Frankliniella fusca]
MFPSRSSTALPQALLAPLLTLALALGLALHCSAQLPSNPYYGNGLQYPSRSGLAPYVYANTASYANTYYLPYAYQNYAPFAPIRT